MIEITKAIVPPTPAYVLAIGNSIGGNVSGGILFGNSANNLAQNSTQLFWDQANTRLGVGIAASLLARLHVKGTGATSATNSLRVQNSNNTIYFNVDDAGNIRGGGATVANGGSSTAFGDSNQATGLYSFAAAGSGGIASGRSSVAFANLGNASGFCSGVFGREVYASADNAYAFGNYTKATAVAAFAKGDHALSYLYGQNTSANGQFDTVVGNVTGDSQVSKLIARKEDTIASAATTTLSLDGTGATGLIIPSGNNRFINVMVKTIATVVSITGTTTGVTVGDCYSEVKNLLFKKVAGVSSIVSTVDTNNVKSDTSMTTALVIITAGASQEIKTVFTAPTFVGGGTVKFRILSEFFLSEIAY